MFESSIKHLPDVDMCIWFTGKKRYGWKKMHFKSHGT